MNELLTYIVQSLVDKPDEVSVTERKADGETVFEVRVAEGDMGKVIGRKGRIVKEIRVLMKAVGPEEGQEGLGRDCRLSPFLSCAGGTTRPRISTITAGQNPPFLVSLSMGEADEREIYRSRRDSEHPRRPRRGQDYAWTDYARVSARRKDALHRRAAA